MKALDPWGPIVGVLFEDGSSDFILTTLARAGIPTHFELTEKESYSHNTRKRAYLKRLGPIYTEFELEPACPPGELASITSTSSPSEAA